MATTDGAPMESFRPSLVKLTHDLRALEHELFDGFGSRREVLEWTQRLSVHTLGELPQEWFHAMATQFEGTPASGKERLLMAAMLTPKKRRRDVDDEAAAEFRRQLSAQTIRPAAHRAFRELRADATEYIDDSSDGQHAASRQRYVAMRPAIDELADTQMRTMRRLLAGFDDRESILDWGHDLELATHGEIPEEFVTRCYQEDPTWQTLVGRDSADARARELFAAKYVVPFYNRGIRDLAGRAGEHPDADREETEVKLA
ncbi:hypothetical protein GWK26_08580 [haloarchaeon 3A1-DGR]|nr:hypothetical protein GWK26_08580 [haloarchaeon 3A1-DGR]